MLVLNTDSIATVDSDLTLEDTFMEIAMEQDSDMMANAIIEAGRMGVYMPMTSRSTVEDIAAMILDGFEELCQFDVASYWAHNFRAVGVL